MLLLLQPLTTSTAPYTLTPNHVYQIGRRSSCDVILSNDSSVSRHHARIRVANDAAFIFDSSTYGTEVNAQRITYAKPQKIRNNDLIRFGTRDYLFQCRIIKGKETRSRSRGRESTLQRPTLASLNKSKSSAEFHFEPSTSPANRFNMTTTGEVQDESAKFGPTSVRSAWMHDSDSPSSPMNQAKTRKYLEELAAPLVLTSSPKAKHFSTKTSKSKRSTVLRIIDSECTDEGNQFYTVEYLDGSTDSVLKELLVARGYNYLIEEFEGKEQSKRYEDYYQSALGEFKKRIGYYKHKYAGFCIAVDKIGEVILFDKDHDTLVEKLTRLRSADPSYRKKYLAPFIATIPVNY